MKRFLILSTSKLTTGAIFHINQCLKSLGNIEGIKIHLHLNSNLDLDFDENVQIKIIKLANISFINLIYILFYIPIYTYLKKIDVIYCPWGISPIFSRGRVVLGVHNPSPLYEDNSYFNRNKIFKLLYRLSMCRASVIKSPSTSFANFLINKYKIKKNKFKVIKHGIDIDDWKRYTEDTESKSNNYFIFWSWFHETKGVEELIYGFKKFLEERPNLSDCNLMLAGRFSSREYEYKINSLIDKLDLTSRIKFSIKPSFTQLVKLISQSKGIIFSFKYETFGYPYLEARTFNKPIAVSQNLVSDEITEGQCYSFNIDCLSEVANAFFFLESNSLKIHNYLISEKFHSKNEVLELSNFFSDCLSIKN